MPGFLARLTHVGGLGADSQQTLKLFTLVSIGWVHVDMQRQLAGLRGPETVALLDRLQPAYQKVLERNPGSGVGSGQRCS